MKPLFSRKLIFMSKSLLWSAVLYITCMLVINWDEVTSGINANRNIPLSQAPAPIPAFPLADTKPVTPAPQTALSNVSHALHAIDTVLTQLVQVANILKK